MLGANIILIHRTIVFVNFYLTYFRLSCREHIKINQFGCINIEGKKIIIKLFLYFRQFFLCHLVSIYPIIRTK